MNQYFQQVIVMLRNHLITSEAIRTNSVTTLVDAIGDVCKCCDLENVKHQLKTEADAVFHFISELAQRAP